MPKVLYSDENLEIIYRAGTSDYLLVSFNEMGMMAGEGRYWASALCNKLDLNCIAFVTRQPNWFPSISLQAGAAAAIDVVKRFQIRIGYGHSQGGYAAIKSSKTLGLTDTLAFSPQWSIDPRVHVDTRFNHYFSTELNSGMEIAGVDQPERLRIFYDPFDKGDADHVVKIAERLTADLVPVPSTNHGTVRVFANSESFAALIEALNSVSGVRRAVRLARAGSAIRHEVTAYRAAIRHAGWSLAILAGGKVADRHIPTICFQLIQQGHGTGALPFARQAAETFPENAQAVVIHALCESIAGNFEVAQELAKRATELSTAPNILHLARRVKSVKAA